MVWFVLTIALYTQKMQKVEPEKETADNDDDDDDEESLCADCSLLLQSDEMTALKGMLPQLEKINLAAMLNDCNRDVERAANLYFARPAFVLKTYNRSACAHLRK